MSKIIFIIRPLILKPKHYVTYTYSDLKISSTNDQKKEVQINELLSNYYEYSTPNELEKKLSDITKNLEVWKTPDLDRDYTIITINDIKYKIYTILVDINKLIQKKPNYNFINMLDDISVKYSFPNEIIQHAMIKSMFRQIAIIPIINNNIILYKSYPYNNRSSGNKNTNLDNDCSDNDNDIPCDFRIINEFAKPHDERTNEEIAKSYFLNYYPNCKQFMPVGYFGFKLPKTNNIKDICCITYIQFIPSESMLSSENHLCIDIDLFDIENTKRLPTEKIYKKSFAIIRNNLDIIRKYKNFQYNDNDD
ncbi:MAG: hypothetical protein KIT69_01835 [Propionibacteriaceae bacterium]|nr:hypothetical protein [Propionibacteriaceae bacterium]